MNQNFVSKVLRDTEQLAGSDCYMKFLALWAVFEAYIRDRSGEGETGRQRDALEWFKNNDNDLKDYSNGFWRTSTEKGQIVNAYERLSGNRPNDDSLEEIIEIIYFVRNKISHGNWRLEFGNNQSDEKSLIQASAQLLRKWISWSSSQGAFNF